jgi:hypothetical protein
MEKVYIVEELVMIDQWQSMIRMTNERMWVVMN